MRHTIRTLILSAVTATAVMAQAHAADGLLVINSGTTIFTGRVDGNGNYLGLRGFTGHGAWTHMVSTGNGVVLFYDGNTGRAVTRRVFPDGSYENLRFYSGFDKYWSRIVSPSNGLLLFYNQNTRVAATARVDANGNFADLKSYTFDPWTNVAPIGNGLLFFYNYSTGAAATGRVLADGSFQDVRSYRGLDANWYDVVATSDGMLVFYNRASGVLALGRIDANGNFADIRTHNFQQYLQLVPSTNGMVMFYRAASDQGPDAVFGRFNAAGSFSSGPRVLGLASSYLIAPVK